MEKKRYDWVMAYHFANEYQTEQLWQAAFKKFLADLKEFDAKAAKECS